jgi:hypothetical protein
MPKQQNKRKGISQKIRFEVFKRDKFRCVYCGASAPDVLLQIDHIDPVAGGGSNNILNLVTACFDCNNGKSDRKLDDHSTVIKQRNQLEELQERREQIEMMLEWQKELAGLKDLLVTDLKKYWDSLTPGFSITEEGLKRIRKLLLDFSYDEIKNAMDISASQYLIFSGKDVTPDSCSTAYSKINGIAKVRKQSLDNPDLKDLFYIRGILKNRLRGYFDASLAITLLKNAREKGVGMEDLRQLALKSQYMSEFEEEIKNLVEDIDNLPF